MFKQAKALSVLIIVLQIYLYTPVQSCSRSRRRSRPPPDTRKPTVLCPADITTRNDPLQDHAWVTYSKPSANDAEDGELQARLSSGRQSASNFPEGQTQVTYYAKDRAGNIGSCSFTVTVNVARCPAPRPIAHGYFVCYPSNDYRYGGQCRYGCYRGYRLQGQTVMECLAKADVSNVRGDWSSSTPSCEKLKCQALVPPSDGAVSCTDSNRFQSKCTYSCNQGYDIPPSNTRVRVCTFTARWLGGEPSCLDVERPKLVQCPVSKIAYTEQGQITSTVTWSVPSVTDNKDRNLAPVLVNGKPPGSAFEVGSHVISYTVSDSAGNQAYPCKFTIYVRQLSCFPVYPTPDLFVTCAQGYGYGAECQFGCRTGYSLVGDQSARCQVQGYPPLPYWSWNIAQPKCQGVACPKLEPPSKGALACDYWYKGEFCHLFCSNGTDFPRWNKAKYSTMLVCGKTNGAWIPPVQNIPDCVEFNVPAHVSARYKYFYFSGDCCDPAVQDTIRSNFISLLTSSAFTSACNQECSAENVEVRCHGDCSTRRKKREQFNTEVSVDLITKPSSDTTNQGAYTEVKRTLEDMQKLIEDEASKAENIISPLTSYDRGESRAMELQCQAGLKPASHSFGCVGCEAGQFLNQTTDECEPCPRGQYQDEASSASCEPCPMGTTTVSPGSKTKNNCLKPCSFGEFSASGLPPCSRCPAGTFSDTLEGTSCTPCPASTWTELEGSRTAQDCKEFDMLFSREYEMGYVSVEKPILFEQDVNTLTLGMKFQIEDTVDHPLAPVLNVIFTAQGNITIWISVLVSKNIIQLQTASCEMSVPLPTKKTIWYSYVVILEPDLLTLVSQTGQESKNCSWTPLSANTEFNMSVTAGSQTVVSVVSSITDVYLYNRRPAPEVMSALSKRCGYVTSENASASWQEFAASNIIANTTIQISSLCDDTDNCVPASCGNHSCVDQLDGVLCVCDPGFTGTTCEVNIDDCGDDNACAQGGSCVDGILGYTCACPANLKGDFCEIDIVSGEWTEWSTWGRCSQSCGGGIQTRERQCSQPPPDPDGLPCPGNNRVTRTCQTQSCPSCRRIDPPLNGHLKCTGDGALTTRVCTAHCISGYQFPIELPLNETRCGPETFYEWIHQNELNPEAMIPDCTATKAPSKMAARHLLNYPDMPCDSDTIQALNVTIRDNVNEINCVKNSTCMLESLRLSGCEGIRIRRQTGVKIGFEMAAYSSEGVQSDEIIDADTYVKLQKMEDLLTEAATKIYEDVKVNRYTVYVENLGSQIPKGTYYVDGQSVDGTMSCPPGNTWVDFICVACGRGTYEAETFCEPCPEGTYQDQGGQTKCELCSVGYTTPYPGAYTPNLCYVSCDDECETQKNSLVFGSTTGADTLNTTEADQSTAFKINDTTLALYIAVPSCLLLLVLSIVTGIIIKVKCFRSPGISVTPESSYHLPHAANQSVSEDTAAPFWPYQIPGDTSTPADMNELAEISNGKTPVYEPFHTFPKAAWERKQPYNF